MKPLSRYLPFVFGIALGGFFFWLAVRDVDLATSLSLLAEANLWYIAPFAAALVVFYRLKAYRWGRLIEPEQPVAAAKLTPSMMIGFAGNNLLPFRLGELIRVYLASRDLSRSKSLILATLLVERVFDMVTVMLLLVITMLVIENNSPEFVAARTLLLAGGLTLLFVAWSVAYTPQWISGIGDRLLARMPARFDARLRPQFGRLRRGFGSLRHRRSLLPLFMNSVAQWLSLTACIYISIIALNIEAPPIAAVAVLGLLVAGISLPGAPGFIGTVEFCFVAGLGFFDVQPSEALSIAIFYHALSFMFVTLSGAFFLKNYGLSWKTLKSEASEIKSAED